MSTVTATRGIFVTCDEPIKQFVLSLQNTLKFGVTDLDETHVLIQGEERILEDIQKKIDELIDQNTFEPDLMDNDAVKK